MTMHSSAVLSRKNRRVLDHTLLCAVGICVNIVVSYLSARAGLSLYLDSIGTILTAAVGGFLPGVITGFVTNLLKGFWNLSSIYYIPINIMLAMVTAFFAQRHDLMRFPRVLLPFFSLAFVGGVIGSFLTWFLNGSIYAGGALSARFVNAGFSLLTSQILGDFMLDFADKGISLAVVLLILRFIPKDMLDVFDKERVSLITDKDKVRQMSLRTKVMLLVTGLMLVVAIAVTGITISLFNDSIIEENVKMAYGAARIAAGAFDADRVPEFIERGDAAAGYAESEAALARIVESAENIDYVYVYQIREDGCHVVFDPDTAAGPGSDPGEIIGFDDAFMEVLPVLLEGGVIDPIISNETYGWLLTVYLPVYDSENACQCYVGVDVSMPKIRSTATVFLAEIISLFLGFSMLVTVLGIQLAEDSLIRPINSMAAATTAFAKRKDGMTGEGLAQVEALDIRTGDEIENLYQAISSTTKEVVDSILSIQRKNEQITRLQGGLIMVLADMVESRDKCTGNHVRNTASYVELILKKMQEQGLYPDLVNDDYIRDVVSSAPLHDVGKIQVPDALLNKPGKLTPEEFEIMKKHTIAGGEIIDSAIEQVADDSSLYLNEARKLTVYHHERWDGKGYLYGLRGEDIPLSARVMAVADVFDALVSRRSYKDSFPVDKALDIIREESGTHFDPMVVQMFFACEDDARAIAEAATIKNNAEY